MGRSQRMRVLDFTGRVQEKILPHHLTTEWVFYLSDVNLPTGIEIFIFLHLKFQLQGNGTCVQVLYSSLQVLYILCAAQISDVTNKYINSTYRKIKKEFF